MPALLLSGVPPHQSLGINKVSACLGTCVALGNFAPQQTCALARCHGGASPFR